MIIGNIETGNNNRLYFDAVIDNNWSIMKNIIINKTGDKTGNIHIIQYRDGTTQYEYKGTESIPKATLNKIDKFMNKVFSINISLAEANTKSNTKENAQ